MLTICKWTQTGRLVLLTLFCAVKCLYGQKLTNNQYSFVEMDPLIVPIVQNRDVKGFITTTLSIECKKGKNCKAVRKCLPVLRDRFLWKLYNLLSVIWSKDLNMDVQSFKTPLLNIANNILGHNIAHNVLLINFQQYERSNVYS